MVFEFPSLPFEGPLPGLRKALLAGLLLAVAMAAFSLSMSNRYTSQVRLLPKDPRAAGGGLGAVAIAAEALGVGGMGMDDPGMAYLDILESRRVGAALLTRTYRFGERGWMFGPQRAHTESLLSYMKAANLDQGLARLPDLLDPQRDMKSGLVTIAATTTSPELSQQVAQGAARELEDYILVHSQTQAGAKAQFATASLAKASAEELQAEQDLEQFLMRNRDYQNSSNPEVRIRGTRLDAQLQLRQQLVANLAMTRDQALLEAKDAIPVLNVLDEGQLPLEKSGPRRALMVAGAFLLGCLGTLAWRHRTWVLAHMIPRSEA